MITRSQKSKNTGAHKKKEVARTKKQNGPGSSGATTNSKEDGGASTFKKEAKKEAGGVSINSNRSDGATRCKPYTPFSKKNIRKWVGGVPPIYHMILSKTNTFL